ncbi:efflux transporter outer membrane subunit [Granulicella tundricola]|uniref:RND efflux system, outer membrane lipoprotein, NodT family n=1 Tax=Granulicella tundricola (strain ATCC BAA-1859 / DSM 23138 / MP5ACTX9) TaxID=1198114 RepID=E8WVA5_GRATM|nr:efflux transporter outer membrane subunit [Granulicella tundricola]ADW67280.1 RND efflux system, outer membrane lipoprotein, NodT family [Granulicella tundricola MP5ACTX9]
MSNISTWTKRAYAIAAGGVLIGTLAGCNVGPKYKRPAYQAPAAFRGPDDAAIASEAKNSLGDQQWAQVFREPELQALITRALTNNYDLRIAAQHIAEQRAQVQITRAQQFPTVSVGGSGVGADFDSSSFGTGSGSGSGITSPLAIGSINVSAAWTPDFWGLYRKQTAAARAVLLAQTWAQRAVRLSLVQDVVTDYLQLRALDHQLEITRQTIKARQDSVDLTKALTDGGSSPLSDLRQAEQLLYTATSQVPQLEQQIQVEENALTLLLGENPGPVAHTDPNALTPPPQDLPTGIPSQLLERRPDIQQAEATLIAANAQIGVARAQFFPQLTISASAGTGGNSFASLVDSSSKTIYGIGSLSQPIFQGGKLRGQLNLAKETQQEDVLAYQKAITTGFHDVSNALIALNKQRAYREQQEKLVAAAQDSTRLARLRYQGGATAYLEVLTTDTALFTAQLNLVTAQQGEALTLVQLYTALGGGWQ